jgi:mRNA-degrading endonuclease RelE of RelBE toxin-antitoxin system
LPDKVVRRSPKFVESFNKIKQRDPPWIKRIEKTIEKVKKDPNNFDHALVGEKNHKLNKYVSLNGYRVLYRFCSYCIAHNQQDIETCNDCTEVRKSGGGIMFLDVFPKNLANTQKKANKIY